MVLVKKNKNITEEQIKQNAEKEASKAIPREVSLLTHEAIKTAYIAGAHNRDEEIKQLKKSLSSTQKVMAELIELYNKERE